MIESNSKGIRSSALDTPIPATQKVQSGPRVAVSLSRKLERLLWLVGLPLILMLGVMAWAGLRLSESFESREVERVYFIHLNSLQGALLNVETGIRGYALSGERRYLEPYNRGQRDAKTALEQLKTDFTFASEVSSLTVKATSFLEDWALRSIGVIDRNGFDTSGQLEVISEGKDKLGDIRTQLESIFAGSEERRRVLREDNRQLTRLVQGLPILVLFLALLGFLFLMFGLKRLVLEPVEQLRIATASLAQGDVAARVHIQSDDELGELSRTLNRSAEVLAEKNADLLRSNRELEQFAYVASHDLQEPLRMVSSYTQLLKKRYTGQLDAKADQYIEFAVDGASRMQRLIQDLLAFSRVGTHPLEPHETDLNAVVTDVGRSLKLALEDVGGQLSHDALPPVWADRGQVSQILQNLIGNGLKFRREGVTPQVHVSAQPHGEMWQISVKDNGIGIDPDYFERIFIIFQRLHTKEQYSGSGIGLAIVKKIVERHGGKLWLESVGGEGSSFHFTLPALPLSTQLLSTKEIQL